MANPRTNPNAAGRQAAQAWAQQVAQSCQQTLDAVTLHPVVPGHVDPQAPLRPSQPDPVAPLMPSEGSEPPPRRKPSDFDAMQP